MRKKQMLATMVMLSLLQGSVYADGGIITTQYPESDEYERIDITNEGEAKHDLDGLVYSGKNIVINNGGNITLDGESGVYGIRVDDNYNNAGYLNVKGDLKIDIKGAKDRDKFVIGVWSNSLYSFLPGIDDAEYKGGTITLDNTVISVETGSKGFGLVAGSTFGNNSAKGGHIVSKGNLDITVTDTKYTKYKQDWVMGVLAYDQGVVEIKGENNTIKVTGLGDGEANRDIAGLYSSHAGKIISTGNSNITIDVTGRKIYGIRTGFYDQKAGDQDGEKQENIVGKSYVDLKGNTIINLNSSYTGYGVHSSMKATTTLNNVTINFIDGQNNIGLFTQTGGVINVNSAQIGLGGKIVNPNKIIAVNLYGKNDLFGVSDIYGNNSGTININNDKTGTVKLNGKIRSLDDGVANITLSSNDSFLYGNTQLSQIYSTNGTINLDIMNGAKWINVQDADDMASRVTTLNLADGGLVDLTDKTYSDGTFQNIYIEKEFNGGNGTINMDIDASTNTNNSDRIYVNGTHKGTHYIKLNPLDENELDGAAGTVLVSVKDEQGEFKAKDSEGALYWNKYTLDRFDTSAGDKVTAGYNTDWYLKEVEQLDEPTTSVDTILGAYALGYHTWRAETDKLMKRMGDLRHNGEDEKGAWFRVRGAEISRDGEASFENKYTVYELGYDEITKKTDRFTRYQGAALSYIDGSSSFARGSGENNGKSIAFYTTEMRNKGHYLDLVFRIADMDSDYKVYDTNGNKITGEPENIGVSLSAEYGRKKVMDDNGWYIEPQGQLTLGYFGGDNYRAKYADQYIDVHQSGIPSVLGRVGFNIGRDIDENTNIYLKANLLHEFCGDYDVDMVDSAGNRRTESDTFNDTWFEYGIGAAIKTGKNNHIYFDFEKTAGGDFEQDWAWNAGMRWTF